MRTSKKGGTQSFVANRSFRSRNSLVNVSMKKLWIKKTRGVQFRGGINFHPPVVRGFESGRKFSSPLPLRPLSLSNHQFILKWDGLARSNFLFCCEISCVHAWKALLSNFCPTHGKTRKLLFFREGKSIGFLLHIASDFAASKSMYFQKSCVLEFEEVSLQIPVREYPFCHAVWGKVSGRNPPSTSLSLLSIATEGLNL